MASVLTVSQLNSYIAFKLKDDFRLRGILVQGEISDFVYYKKSGHFYFTLKDGTSSIKAVMFSNNTANLKFIPENGMRVILCASVQVYERDGLYQLYVTDIQPSGIGALYIAFEQLKAKLEKEGLFTPEAKRPIPLFPKKIGVITSKSGAALQDIINIITRRYPVTEINVFPCQVQGTDAPQSIVTSINQAQESDCDVLIVGRGGGSFEDLNAFNYEIVARTIFNSRIPVISAVGHETDTTISDYVADLRAPTPSAAAELAVPDINELKIRFKEFDKKLYSLENSNISKKNELLKSLFISKEKLSEKLSNKENKLNSLNLSLNNSIKEKTTENQNKLEKLQMNLSLINPFSVLLRGYTLVYKDKTLIKNTDNLKNNEEIKIRFSDGYVKATVNEITKQKGE